MCDLSDYCLPYLTTLYIVNGDNSRPSEFFELFEYNCFPSLKKISLLVSKDNSLKTEGFDKIKEESLLHVDDSHSDQPSSIHIGKLKFKIKYHNDTVNYLDNYYSSASYMYTCKSDDRLANLPGGLYRFKYNDHLYPFNIRSRDITSSIVEVSHSFHIHL